MSKIGTTFLAIAVLFSATSFISCSKDKEENTGPSNNERIAGTWKLSEVNDTYTVLGTPYTETTEFGDNETIEFKADGTLVALVEAGTFDGNWSVSGDKFYITGTGLVDYPAGYKIAMLNSTELHLYYKVEEASTSVERTVKLKK